MIRGDSTNSSTVMGRKATHILQDHQAGQSHTHEGEDMERICPFSTVMTRMVLIMASLPVLTKSTQTVDQVSALRVYSKDAPSRFSSAMKMTNTPKIMISKNRSIAKVSNNLSTAHTVITPKMGMMLPLGKAN